MSKTINTIKKLISERKIASPAYVFSQSDFERRAQLVKEAFGNNIDICFSIKANPFLLAFLPDTFAKVEVCSPGELEICKKLNLDPSRIIFSGVNKTSKDIKEALSYGAGTITLESRRHLELLLHELEAGNREAVDVIPRLSDESQFGLDENELTDILKHRNEYPSLNFVGLHFFTGTAKKKVKEISRELARLEKYLDSLKEICGFIPEVLEYGPGLSVDYFAPTEEEAEENDMLLLKEAAEAIRDFDSRTSAHLTIEMGRFYAATSGYYITRIEDLKYNDGDCYAIVDGGLHQLKYFGQLQGMQKPVTTHLPAKQLFGDTWKDGDFQISSLEISKDEAVPTTICGSLCTTADVLVRNYPLLNPATGDFLVYHRTGAYSVMEGMALFLSRDLPSVYLLDKNDELEVRRERRETAMLNI